MRGLARPTGPREAVVVWAGEFFFLKQRPVALQRPAIEELDAALIGPERAERDPALTQTEQVAPYLFLAQLIRRTAVVRGQPTDRIDVDGLRCSRQPRRLHVFDHLQSQRRHRGLPWIEQAGATAPAPRKNSLNSNAVREAPPYGEAVQSNDPILRLSLLFSLLAGNLPAQT